MEIFVNDADLNKKITEVIHVLWIDDECKDFEDDIENFWQEEGIECDGFYYTLKIHPFDNWKDGERETLLNKKVEISAIILDVDCKYDNSKDNPSGNDFVLKAFTEVKYKYSHLPYFVFSGGSEEKKNLDLLNNNYDYEPHEAMYEWLKKEGFKYYRKSLDSDKTNLRSQIIKKYSQREDVNFKNCYFPNVFRSLRNLNVDQEVEEWLYGLLRPIYFPGIKLSDYLIRGDKLRNCMEHLFRTMSANYLMPPNLVDKGNDDVNVSYCFDWILDHLDKFRIPHSLERYIEAMKYIIPALHHTKSDDLEKIEKYFERIESSYLIYSLSFWLCDFILWLHNFILTNSDIDYFKSECEKELKKKTYTGTLYKDVKNNWYIKPDKEIKNANPKILFDKLLSNKIKKLEENGILHLNINDKCEFRLKIEPQNKPTRCFARYLWKIDEEFLPESGKMNK